MLVKTMNERDLCEIGHAFGFYDYGEETGLRSIFSGREATADYICAYVRGMLRGGFLYSTSERGEGYIAFKRLGEKLGLKTMLPIARAFLKDAPIVLLDEATASLDAENETLSQTALSRLIQNKTVLDIAHRMRTVAGADKIVVLRDGTVAEQGRPDELYAQNGLYTHVVKLQTGSQSWMLGKA